MAGREKDVGGECWLAEGASVGFLEQEPALDPAKSVEENVTLGLAVQKRMVERFEEVSARPGEVADEDEMNALIAEQAELQEKIETDVIDRRLTRIQGRLVTIREF